jgi:1-acyl-sn-glycerol-3-phosphate acyltransferase
MFHLETRWVAKRELSKIPVFGPALRRTGQILIDRGDHEQAVRELKESLNRRGCSVVFFAEGRRAPTTELQPFKKGGAAFAIDAGLPVVPVAVSGSQNVLEKYSLVVRPGVIRVMIGDPIDVTGLTADDRVALTDRVRNEIEAMLATMEPRPYPKQHMDQLGA